MPVRFFAILLIFLAPTAIAWEIDAGDKAPPWNHSDFMGQPVAFPDVTDGKPAVVIFWATWCNYCTAFMPYLGRIQQDYAAKGVKVIAINAKERGIGDPDGYLEALGFPVTGILEGDDIAADYDIQFIPGLMVVDGAGMVSYRRASTELPPGKKLSEIWDEEVRAALNLALR
jgi:thiol-disulfide isomerase/thioredoxin